MMSARELFVMSLTSTRARRFMKPLIPKGSIKLNFCVPAQGGLQISADSFTIVTTEFEDPKMHSVKMGRDHMHFSFCGETLIYCIWEYTSRSSREKLLKTFLAYFIEIFNKPSVSFFFTIKSRGNERMEQELGVLEILKHISQLPIKLLEVSYASREVSPEVFETFMKACVPASHGTFDVTFSEPYYYTPPSADTFKFDKFSASLTNWWRLENFLHCKTIVLEKDPENWGVEYLNEFLHNLINMESSLQRLEMPLPISKKFELIVKGLSENPIQKTMHSVSLEIQTNQGRRMLIDFSYWDHIFRVVEIID